MRTLFITISLFVTLFVPLAPGYAFAAKSTALVLDSVTLVAFLHLLRRFWALPIAEIIKAVASSLSLIAALQHERRRLQRSTDKPSETGQLEQRPFWSSITLWAAILAFIESVITLF